MEFIELLKLMETECTKRNDGVKDGSIEFDDICEKCKFKKECDTVYRFGSELYEVGPMEMDIKAIENYMKELNL